MITTKQDIRRMNLVELEEYFQAINQPKFRAKQLFEWLWNKGVHRFEQMSNLPKSLREDLDKIFTINCIAVHKTQKSNDGTIKNAIRLYDGNIVESVLIPTQKRTTACVSSQVGCSLNCTFCATARIKRMRNLNAAEIYDQVVLAHQQSEANFGKPLSNIVFMGMGEPMMNYPQVMKAIEMITNDQGLGMAPRRITVSTSGIPKMIKKMADEQPKFKLAVSLHSAQTEIRSQIMPFNENFGLDELLESLQYWYQKTKSKITFEYIIWKGVNDTPEAIKALIKYCKSVPSKVNLISYNPIESDGFQQADATVITAYVAELEQHNIVVKIRKSRGQDIDAACGQLANKI